MSTNVSPAPSFCERVIRASLCPSSSLDARTRRNGEALDRAVWEHVRDLLGDPQRLLAQFQDFALAADQEAAREAALRLRAILKGPSRV